MSKYRVLNRGDVLPASFLAALQEFVGPADEGINLTAPTTTTVRVTAGTGDAQVTLGIGGLWRYITANATATHPGGAAATFDILAVASANIFSNTPTPDTDTTDYAFGLQIVASGGAATGTFNTRAIVAYRKIGTCVWNGTAITRVTPIVGDNAGQIQGALTFDGDAVANLYRNGASVVQTDGTFQALGNMTAWAGTSNAQTLDTSGLRSARADGLYLQFSQVSGQVTIQPAGTAVATLSFANVTNGIIGTLRSRSAAPVPGSGLEVSTDLYSTGNMIPRGGAATQVQLGSVGGNAGIGFGAAVDAMIWRNGPLQLYTDSEFKVFKAAGGSAFSAILAADAQVRFVITTDGAMTWGTGAAARDTTLYRGGVGILRTDTTFEAGNTTATFFTRLSGTNGAEETFAAEANPRWRVSRDVAGSGLSGIGMGAGGASAMDTLLYRFSATTLKTQSTMIWGPTGAAVGSVQMIPGSAAQAGYVAWMKSTNLRLGYMGFDNTNLTIQVENGAGLQVNSTASLALTAEQEHLRVQPANHTWTTAPALQRFTRFTAPTMAGTAATVTFANAATVSISGPPSAGANAAITSSYALLIEGGSIAFGNAPDVALTRPVAGGLGSSGTFQAGGNITITGTGAFTARGLAIVGNTSFVTRISTDTVDRFSVTAAGLHSWGDGTAAVDTTLYRGAADTLRTDDQFSVQRAATANVSYDTYVVGDTFSRLQVRADGQMVWGPGNLAGDTNLYRGAADQLKTDDTFFVNNATGIGINTAPTASALVNLPASTTVAAGGLLWGTDVNLYRIGVGVLRSDNNMQLVGYISMQQVGDTQPRIALNPTSGLNFGPGGATTTDTQLIRNGAGVLGTPGRFQISAAASTSVMALDLLPAGLVTDSTFIGFASARAQIGYDGANGAIILRDGGSSKSFRLELGATTNPGPLVFGAFATGQTVFPVALSSATAITIGGDTTLYRNGADVLQTDDRFHSQRSVTGDFAFSTRFGADTLNRWSVQAGGLVAWGDGTTTGADTNLYRGGAVQLKTDSRFLAATTNGGPVITAQQVGAAYSSTLGAMRAQTDNTANVNVAYDMLRTGDTSARLAIGFNGEHTWGPGNAVGDTNLYRNGSASLITDHSLTVGQGFLHNGTLLAFYGGTQQTKKTGYGSGSQVVAGTKGALTASSTLNDVLTNLSSLIADLRAVGLIGA